MSRKWINEKGSRALWLWFCHS